MSLAKYKLLARNASGTELVSEGQLAKRLERHDAVPIAQTIVNSVFAWDGHIIIGESFFRLHESWAPPEFLMEYSSTAADRTGIAGAGWAHSLDSFVKINSCGYYILKKGHNSMWYTRDASGRFINPQGFNSTLLEDSSGDLIFYSLDGARWAYKKTVESEWRLDSIRRPGGEEAQFRYHILLGRPVLEEVVSGNSRLNFHYVVRDINGDLSPLLHKVSSVLNSAVEYFHDDQGLLVKAIYTDDSGAKSEARYKYKIFQGFAALIESSRSNHDGSRYWRRDRYEEGHLRIVTPSGSILVPSPKVVRTEESDGTIRGYSYLESGSLDETQRVMTMTINGYLADSYAMDGPSGLVTKRESSEGVRYSSWDPMRRRVTMVRQPDGSEFRYQYDEYSNVTRIDSGEFAWIYHYYRPDHFDLPYIKNRIKESIEPDAHKIYIYDGKGILVDIINIPLD